MQQTQTYKLNLIETSDTFSPAPLNENMEKVETQLNAIRDAVAAGDAALSDRVTVLEGHKVAAGTYPGDGESYQFVPLPFTPKVVYVHAGGVTALAVPEISGSISIKDGGFQASGSFNRSITNYPYFAIC